MILNIPSVSAVASMRDLERRIATRKVREVAGTEVLSTQTTPAEPP